MLDHRFTILAIAPAARGVAEVGVAPGSIHRYIIGKTEGQAIGAGAQGAQCVPGVQRQQPLDPIGNDQAPVRVLCQAQGAAAGVGQHLQGVAVRCGADDPPVMQAGDQPTLGIHQQRLGPGDVLGADPLDLLQALVLAVGPILHRRRLGGCPIDWLDLGGHQQQKGDDGDQYQPQQMTDFLAHGASRASLEGVVAGSQCNVPNR